MEKITAIIVDDEESARNVLSNLLKRFCPEISILDTYDNLLDAVDGIQNHQPQVVFLDIEMPNYRGIEIVNYFDSIPFQIVFTTAYDQYAIRAFEISAFDYLLKPIAKKRLMETVEKLSHYTDLQHSKEKFELLSATLNEEKVDRISVIEHGYRRLLKIEDIIAIEAQESYSRIYIQNESSILVSNHLKFYEESLDKKSNFFRTHKSWLINTIHVINYSKSRFEITMINEMIVKLSRYKSKDFEVVMKETTV